MNEPLSSHIPATPLPAQAMLRAAISAHWLADEASLLTRLLGVAQMSDEAAALVVARAADWVTRVRELREQQSPLDAFMQQYDLSSDEGVLLMCLAEALLRIPDDDTAEKLIVDKLSSADWEAHLGESDSLFVNASTWGLMLTGRIVKLSPTTTGNVRAAIHRLIGKSTEPVIRLAIRQAMRLMGSQFVMGRDIRAALRNARSREHRAYLHSYDMLGEAALTAADAERYWQSYQQAILATGAQAEAAHDAPVFGRPGISVKLSALHPRYEHAQRARVLAELTPKLLRLAQLARDQNIALTVDAEEADRLDLSLDLFERVYTDDSLGLWEGFGLAVQAFQKRALFVVDWLEALAQRGARRIPVRLVKGAYWDTEVKRAQEQGLPGYPVFTRKVGTDVAYLACARRLLAARERFYPMLATHNAHTVAAVLAYAGDECGYEFQRLHGMGEALYEIVREDVAVPCRVYAPVGSHEDLLPYLVRRLLENGANTSFVNRIFDEQMPASQLVADPVATLRELAVKSNPNLPQPVDLYGAQRRNSQGLNLADDTVEAQLLQALDESRHQPLMEVAVPRGAPRASPAVAVSAVDASVRTLDDGGAAPHTVSNPADRRERLGAWRPLSPQAVAGVVAVARTAQPIWAAQPLEHRVQMLERAADRLEARRAEFLSLLVREAGKTLPDALAEVREAADFLRYYAVQARRLLATPQVLPGPTGEHNELQLQGKGVFVCISPWNFPLAIYTGQIAAALATGNTVIAKPAEQTPLIALRVTELLHEAGAPPAVLQCVLGAGDIGAALVADPGIAGVVFTGSFEVAQRINRSLAAREGAIATLIAETGGQNAMIVDSSALPEQVVKDVIHSAFLSAGQRCSALRVLFLQNDIADKTLSLLQGALRERIIGDPALLTTDIGPVIDEPARARLQAHVESLRGRGWPMQQLPLPEACRHGSYFAPCVAEIPGMDTLDGEYFGPMLHVVRYAAQDLEAIVRQINASGYGLTLGVHTRIESTWRRIQALARVGNCYVNRTMTGAVVGTQPFGGEGLSGTGPKAGGPHYLLRFVNERTLTVNTAAVGGNARLLAASG